MCLSDHDEDNRRRYDFVEATTYGGYQWKLIDTGSQNRSEKLFAEVICIETVAQVSTSQDYSCATFLKSALRFLEDGHRRQVRHCVLSKSRTRLGFTRAMATCAVVSH